MEFSKEAVESIKTILKIIIAIEIIILIPLTLWKLPLLQVAHIESSITDPLALAELENKFRATLAQIFGGIAILYGLYLTGRRISINEKRADIAENGQITERFTRAIDQLGSDKLEVRTGGIYSLGRIANESYEDYWPIMEILTSYIRKNSPLDLEKFDEELPIDIHACITILRRRRDYPFNDETYFFNLENTYLKKADLTYSNLYFTNLSGANLSGANFSYAKLRMVIFMGTNLTGAKFWGTDLSGASFFDSNLNLADLVLAKGLSIIELSQAATLYEAKIDDELKKELLEKHPHLFEKPLF